MKQRKGMIWRKISGMSPGIVGKLEKRWDGKVSEGKNERGEVIISEEFFSLPCLLAQLLLSPSLLLPGDTECMTRSFIFRPLVEPADYIVSSLP